MELGSADKEGYSIETGLCEQKGELADFLTAFMYSQMMSIDAFLARRPEYINIGKRAIAAVLLRCEHFSKLFTPEHPDHWYQYLFNEIAVESWEALDFSKLQIISFNYDRSLEHYLLTALRNAYGRSTEEVLAKLTSLSILHIYGTLGATLPNSKGYVTYGKGANRECVSSAAETLRVIPEGRSDDVILRLAREQLKKAKRIAFLGFGFDLTNLQRIDSEETCRARSVLENGTPTRRLVVGTCLGLTMAERVRAIELTAGLDGDSMVIPRGGGGMQVDTFMDAECLTVLRSTLIL